MAPSPSLRPALLLPVHPETRGSGPPPRPPGHMPPGFAGGADAGPSNSGDAGSGASTSRRPAAVPAGAQAALTAPASPTVLRMGRPALSPAVSRVPSLAQVAFRTFEKNVDLESALDNWELFRDNGHPRAPAVADTCLEYMLAHLPEARASAKWARYRDALATSTAAVVKEQSTGYWDRHAGWKGREDMLLLLLEDMGIERVAQVVPMPTVHEAASADLPQIVKWYLTQPVWTEGSQSALLASVRFDREAVVTKLLSEGPPASVLRVLLSHAKPETLAAWVNRTGPWEARDEDRWDAYYDGQHLCLYAKAGDLDLLQQLLSYATSDHMKRWTSYGTALFVSAWRSGHQPTVAYLEGLLSAGSLASSLRREESWLRTAVTCDRALLDIVAPVDALGERPILKNLSLDVKKAWVKRALDTDAAHFLPLFLDLLAASGSTWNRRALFAVGDGSPFRKAVSHGDLAIVETLMAQAERDGAKEFALRALDYHAFALAASTGQTEILRRFIEVLGKSGELSYAKSADRHLALYRAVQKGHVEAAELLLAEPGYLERVMQEPSGGLSENERRSLFAHAARGGHFSLLERFLDALPDDEARRSLVTHRDSHLQNILRSGKPGAVEFFFRLAERFGIRDEAVTYSFDDEPYEGLSRLAWDHPAALMAVLASDELTPGEKASIVSARSGDALYGLTRNGSVEALRAALRHVSAEQAQAFLQTKHVHDSWDAAVDAVLREDGQFLDAWLAACGDFDATHLLRFLAEGGQRRDPWELNGRQRTRLAKLLPETTTRADVVALAAHYGDVPALTRYIDAWLRAPAVLQPADSRSDDDVRARRRLFKNIVEEGGLRVATQRGQVDVVAQLLRLVTPLVALPDGRFRVKRLKEAMETAGSQHSAEADAVAESICAAVPEAAREGLRAAYRMGATGAMPLAKMAEVLAAASPARAPGVVAQAWTSVQAHDHRNRDNDRYRSRDGREQAAWARRRLMGLLFDQPHDVTIRVAAFNMDRALYLKRAQEGDLQVVAQLERMHGELAVDILTKSGLTPEELTEAKAHMPKVYSTLMALATDKATAVLGGGLRPPPDDAPRSTRDMSGSAQRARS
jgi:hypothetical protein